MTSYLDFLSTKSDVYCDYSVLNAFTPNKTFISLINVAGYEIVHFNLIDRMICEKYFETTSPFGQSSDIFCKKKIFINPTQRIPCNDAKVIITKHISKDLYSRRCITDAYKKPSPINVVRNVADRKYITISTILEKSNSTFVYDIAIDNTLDSETVGYIVQNLLYSGEPHVNITYNLYLYIQPYLAFLKTDLFLKINLND